jgi:hypothetical protein
VIISNTSTTSSSSSSSLLDYLVSKQPVLDVTGKDRSETPLTFSSIPNIPSMPAPITN